MRHGATARVIAALAAGLAGCEGGGPSSPTAPARQVQQQPTPSSAVTLSGMTLHGFVTEATATGEAPIAGVTIYCDACGADGHTGLSTDANGYYSFSGDVSSGGGIWVAAGASITLWVVKEGYRDPPGLPTEPGWRSVSISGDTRFDITLVRE